MFQRMELLAIVVVTIGDVDALDPAEKRIKRKAILAQIESQILEGVVVVGVAKNVAEAAHCPLVGITDNADPSELAGIGIHQPSPIARAIRQYFLPILMGPWIIQQCLFKKTGDGKVPENGSRTGGFC